MYKQKQTVAKNETSLRLSFVLADIGTELRSCPIRKPIVLPNLDPFDFLVSAVVKAFAAA